MYAKSSFLSNYFAIAYFPSQLIILIYLITIVVISYYIHDDIIYEILGYIVNISNFSG